MDLRNWILERITPAVMIVSSQEADMACSEKNGLTLADLLRPHGYFHHLSVPVRTVGETSYRIRELRLRFYHSHTMVQPSEEAADEHLQLVVSALAEQLVTDDPPDILASLRKGEVQEQMPWFERYRQEFFRMLAFSEHECFDHPVACLFVLHSSVDDAPAALRQLQAQAQLPPLMRQGIMEPHILHHCLLLHDESAGVPADSARAEEKAKALRGLLGASGCTLLHINSGGGDEKAVAGHAGLWRAHYRTPLPVPCAGELSERPPEPPQGLGACLSSGDLEGIAKALEDFTVRALLPHLEMRLRMLNQQVASMRKGLRNQLKTLLWRKQATGSGSLGDTPPIASASGPTYGTGTVEGLMRALADLAFMMQDYDLAGTTLRLLASDLKADKAWRHYAGAQEMLGLAAFMSGGSMGEVVGHFREAFHRYNVVATAAQEPRAMVRYATRSAMLLAEYARTHRQFGDAHAALMRAHFQEDNLRAALLLEQAALFQLHMSPPLLRKFAFHTVLAGLRYNSCKQQRLGMRAYQQVLPVYRKRGWVFIEEHLHDVLGKQLREASDLEGASRHFMAQLPCDYNPEGWQGYYLRQFLESVAEAGTKNVLELPLPDMDVAHVRVRHDDQVCYADAASLAQPAELWRRLEGPLAVGSEGGTSWLEAGGSRGGLAAMQASTVVADERLSATVSVSNPMAVQLSLSHLRIECSHDACNDDSQLSDYVQVEEIELELAPWEQTQVTVSVKPLQPGLLTLQGMAWTLNGHALGFRAFPIEGASPGSPLNRRCQVTMTKEPSVLLRGQLHCCHLMLRNVGATPLRSLRLSSSNPDALFSAPEPLTDQDPLTFLTDHASAEASGRDMPDGKVSADAPRCLAAKGGVRVHTWPPRLTLQPGEALPWRLWLHPQNLQQLALHFSWYYEAAIGTDSMKHRLLRMSRAYEVQPALVVTPLLAPSQGHLHRCLLRLDLDNSQGTRALRVCEVACSSPGWHLQHLAGTQSTSRSSSKDSAAAGTANTSASTSVLSQQLEMPPGSRTSLFYHLTPPQRSGGSVTSGVRWMEPNAGPLGHFQQRRLPPGPTRTHREHHPHPSSTPDTPPTPFAVAKEDVGADILVAWRAAAGSEQDAEQDADPCAGVAHLHDCRVQEGCAPVRMVAAGPPGMRHDFKRARVCVVPVQLHLRNCLPHTATLSVEAGHMQPHADHSRAGAWRGASGRGSGGDAGSIPSTPSGGSLDGKSPSATAPGPPPAADYAWCGRARVRIPDLAAGQPAEVTLQVAVFAPGIYEISDYAVLWTTTEHGMHHGSCPGPPFLLNVDAV